MMKILKRLLVLILAMLILISAGLFYGYLNKDSIEELIVSEINRTLDIEVAVQDIEFSIFENFPRASLKFTNLQTKEKEKGNVGHLLNAGEISVLINLYDILRKDYNIQRIILKDAFLNFVVFSDGSHNYNVLRGKKDTARKSKVKLDLQNVLFRNVQVSYLNYRTDQEYFFRVNDGRLNGAFQSESYSLDAKGGIFVELLRAGKAVVIKKRELVTEIALIVNKQNKTYTIENCKLNTSSLQFSVTGTFESKRNGLFTNLIIESEKASLAYFLELVPAEFLQPIQDYSLKGDLLFRSEIKGELSGELLPFVTFRFELERGELSDSRSEMAFNDVQFKGTFENGKLRSKKSFRLRIEDFKAHIRSGELLGNLDIEDFDHPGIKVDFSTRIELDEFNDFIKADTLQAISGYLDVDMQFQNKLKSFDKFTISDFLSSTTTGELKLNGVDVELKRSTVTYKNINGSFRFSNKDLIIDQLNGNFSGSDFDIHGEFINILPFVFRPNERIIIKADIASQLLRIEDLLMYKTTKNDTLYRLRFSPFINFDLNLDIQELSFRKFNAKKIQGKLMLKNKKIFVEDVSLNTMDGISIIDGIIDGTNSASFKLSCNAEFESVDIQKLFTEFGNFNQSSITSNNLRGSVDASIYYSSRLSPELRVDAGSIYTLATLHISNGELVNYTPLYKLSSFVKRNELEHIHFSSLKNRIRIQDRMVFIPEMDIESNTLNLKLNGNHSFDNMIDYHVQVKLAEILNRNKKETEQIDGIFEKEDPTDGANLFLRMTGNARDPQIKYDVKAVQKKLSNDFKDEGKELKDAFRKEFKFLEGEDDSELILEEKDGQKDFLIEWEEDPTDSLIEPPVKPEKRKKKPTKKKKEEKDFIISWDEENDTINSPLP